MKSEPRNIANSQYNSQIEVVNMNELSSLIQEDGALVICEDICYISINNIWKEIAINNTGGPTTGWIRVDDTQYVSTEFNVVANTKVALPNNAGNVVQNGDIGFTFDDDTFWPQATNDAYLVTIAFESSIQNANGHLELSLAPSSITPYDRVIDIMTYPKGANTFHKFSKVMQFYADSDVLSNGIQINVKASHVAHFKNIIFFFQRVHRGI